MGRDPGSMRSSRGEVFGTLAYGHPLLKGNGTSLRTVHADLGPRAGFHIAWQDIGKADFPSSLAASMRRGSPRPRAVRAGYIAGHSAAGGDNLLTGIADLRVGNASGAGTTASSRRW